MKHILSPALILALLLPSIDCGDVFIRAAIETSQPEVPSVSYSSTQTGPFKSCS